MTPIETPSLARLVAHSQPVAVEVAGSDACDLCSVPVPDRHRHLLDIESGELLCACTACRILFESGAAGGRHFRLVPERRLLIADCDLDDVAWDALRIPVRVAFFAHSTTAGRMVARYPGALGAAESTLSLESWRDVAQANPVLATMQADVEAFLVHHQPGGGQHFVVPIDECYRLVGIIRTEWKGFTGGKEVWRRIERFFAELTQRSTTTMRELVMDHVRTGKAQASHDTPSHVSGINEGNAEGNAKHNKGHLANGQSTARRSTGVNPDDQDAIDPRMPSLSPP